MFHAVKKPHYGRRTPCYDIYQDHTPFLILGPGEKLFAREARLIADILNRYYELPSNNHPYRRAEDFEK